MTSINGNGDFSKLSPARLEQVAQFAFKLDREASFVPYMMLAWLDALCLGLTIVLSAQWFRTCWSTERQLVKYLAYWVISLSFASSGVILAYHLIWFGDGFGIYRNFLGVVLIKTIVLLGAAVRVPVMSFYLHRAYVLIGKQIWVVLLVAPLIAYVGVAPVAQLWLLPALPYSKVMQRVLASASLCSVIADVLITAVIAVQLYRSRTGWSSTNQMITQLLSTLAETQTPPLIMQLITLILFYASPNSTIQMITVFAPKISCLCLLVTLISRISISNQNRSAGSNVHSKSYNSAGLSRSGAEGSRSAYEEISRQV